MKTTMSREEVIRGIVKRDLKRQQLTEEAVLAEAPDLHQSACAQFGAWETALRYAGISTLRAQRERDYSRDWVLKTVRLDCSRGYNLTGTRVRSRRYRLYRAAMEHFGTWKRALQAAGIDLKRARLHTSKPRRLDREEIVRSLREWQEAGHSLAWRTICLENRALATAARQAFGNWPKAMAATNNQKAPKAEKVMWDRDRVIEAIRKRQQEGKSLSSTVISRDEGGLFWAAKKYFGTWRKAKVAAGVKPAPIGRRRGG